ncbi:MAG: SUMF1/EgtB/PvdO family nonheme iron enzyme [Chloroflexi bacterium]|uniref:SUMF1/EgtB/PvdO family nonheme iron enzyme n=1 Tax=Candidatus Flexifilum breve TaxID=3140694 RepID=UPI00313655C2|nr:SUMF1/EgtB/PvdO family nonheme iron enzyme [Chloroflexota bacterium]
MRLFISYARVDKPYCVQIAETLDIHSTWFDQRLYAGQHWWREILRRLDWCEGFIYLLSPDSIASEYCQKEYKIAQNTGKHIFPVLIRDGTTLPKELVELQYVDFTKGMTPDVVKGLLNSIHLAERSTAPRAPVSKQNHNKVVEAPTVPNDVTTVIGKAAEAMEVGKFDESVFMLKQAIERGLKSRFINLEALLAEAEGALERQVRLREIELEYKNIAELVKRKWTRPMGCQAFQAFRKDVPNYDPDNLAEICANEQISRQAQPQAAPRAAKGGIPLLEWCEIPAGILHIGENGKGSQRDTLHVEAFQLAKYPVTNGQFQLFIDDPRGYANQSWWGFSPYAAEWRRLNPQPAASQFQGADRPRENVTWFEAVAFACWLSDKLGMQITLPTRQQWQRAARGDDQRVYPWGNEFDTTLCNTRESRLRQTTLVMRYVNGTSQHGVYDMAGNVWEWCLNGNYDDTDKSSNAQRSVQGGSFISAHERAQTGFTFKLSPEYHYGSIGFRLACVR